MVVVELWMRESSMRDRLMVLKLIFERMMLELSMVEVLMMLDVAVLLLTFDEKIVLLVRLEFVMVELSDSVPVMR